MQGNPDNAVFEPVYPRTIRLLIVATATVAGLVLLGWLLRVETLKRLLPGNASMNPLTALAFVLLCAALWQLKDGPLDARRSWRARLPGLLVLLVGASKLLDLAAGTSLCPDDLLFHSQLGVGQDMPSRVAPNSAICLALLGLGIVLLDLRGWPSYLHPQWLMVPSLVLPLAALVGYFYNSSGFYRYQHYAPMAIHTAVCFMLLALALILCRPQQGFMQWIPRGSIGARGFRRMLPACVLVPTLLGAAELIAVGRGRIDAQAGAALTSVATVLLMSVLAYIAAVSINRIDAQRRRADQELLAREQQERRASRWAVMLGELEELMRSHGDDLRRGADGVLGMLVRTAGAQQGGFYLAVPQAQGEPRLQVLSLYAYDQAAQPDASFAMGQGLVGQCAAGRKALRIDAVPAGYFRLRSANLEAPPQHLLFLPVVLDNEALGVLEFAFAAPPDAEVERFLNSALRIVAFGIYRYNRYHQAQQLGEELRRLRAG